MSAAAVVIELPAGSEGSPAGDLVRACSDHLRLPGGCVLAAGSATATADETRAVAIVSWGPGQESAHVQVGVRGRERPEWPTADLAFRPDDPPTERWKAVGLAIAALVGDGSTAHPQTVGKVVSGAAPSASAPAPSAPEHGGAASGTPARSSAASPLAESSDSSIARLTSIPSPGPSDHSDLNKRRAPSSNGSNSREPVQSLAWIDAAGMTTSGGLWGGSARGVYRMGDTRWMAWAAASYVTGAVAGPDPAVTLSRVATGAGGAFELERGRGQVEAHCAVLVDWFHAAGFEALRGRDSVGYTAPELLLGASAGFFLAPPLAAFAGGDLLGRPQEIDVRAGNQTVARIPAVDGIALLGLRIVLD